MVMNEAMTSKINILVCIVLFAGGLAQAESTPVQTVDLSGTWNFNPNNASSTTIQVPGGRATVVSVASPGEATFSAADPVSPINTQSFQEFGDITVRNDSSVAVDGPGGGTIVIRGGKLMVENSMVSAFTNGAVAGGGIDDGFCRGQKTFAFAIFNHAQRRSGFYRPARVEPLRFGKHYHVGRYTFGTSNAMQRQQRCIANLRGQSIAQGFADFGRASQHK